MENHTKRIRKARRQGLAKKKDLSTPSRRLQVSGRQRPAAATPTAAANPRRRGALTQRKTERQARTTTRRATGRRTRG